MKARVVPLAPGDTVTRKARRALLQRAAAVTVGPLPTCPEAAAFWSERAWSELAAVPAMSQSALAWLRHGGDTDSLGSLMQMGVDEVRHAELARDVAEGLGGYEATIPPGAAWEPALLGEPSGMPLPFWVVANGCISETVSLALMQARAAHTHHPVAARVLRAVMKDEAVHQRVGWNLAKQVLPAVSRPMQKELGEYARAMFEMLFMTFATRGLTPRHRQRARHIREVTAARGLGACPPDEADHVCQAVIEGTIVPRLRALGVPVPAPR